MSIIYLICAIFFISNLVIGGLKFLKIILKFLFPLVALLLLNFSFSTFFVYLLLNFLVISFLYNLLRKNSILYSFVKNKIMTNELFMIIKISFEALKKNFYILKNKKEKNFSQSFNRFFYSSLNLFFEILNKGYNYGTDRR